MERAEFYLCLARAFLPPLEERDFHALKEQLAPELEELGAVLGYPIGRPLEQFRAALARMVDKQGLLQLYSRLFLAPPTPAHLNAGVYLDGAVMGRSTLEIEAHCRHFGLVRSPEFHDTPDHLSSLLEFLAFVCGLAEEKRLTEDEAATAILLRDAGDFARDYVARWLPALRRDLDEADAYVYAALAEALQTAVTHDFARADDAADASARPYASSPIGGPQRHAADRLHCRRCGAALVATDEMHDILLTLRRSGLGTEHLELCPECRTHSMGLSRLPTPDPKRLRH